MSKTWNDFEERVCEYLKSLEQTLYRSLIIFYKVIGEGKKEIRKMLLKKA